MDKWLAAIAALIFLLCSLLLLDDLRVIQLPVSFFGREAERNSDEQPLAKLIRQDNDVRRRSQHDIAWQSLNQGTPLYANDSVLTLASSGAVVEVGNSGRIELGENTLIVLEKSRADTTGEIRLRFKRGRIAGREGSGSVASGEWDLSFREGTKFEIRAVGDEQFEVDVQSGSIEVQNKNGQRQTVSSQSVRLEQDKLLTLKKDLSLRFKDGSARRLYQHLLEPIQVEWVGEAQTLNLEDQAKPLSVAGQNSTQLSLDFGTHLMKLHSGSGESEVLRLEVRKAPVLHLYAPLPRERVVRDSQFRFEWRKHPSAEKSFVEISSSANFETLVERLGPADDHLNHRFTQTGRYYWRVVAEDHEGARIPALYHNEIFSVDAPLEAPDLTRPEVEEPPRYPSGAHYRGLLPKILSLLFYGVTASANEKVFVFEWGRVKGAEKYVLEVDDDPYFQSPEVITEPAENRFRWKPKRLGVFHWRVAADSKGRMGLFSPVQKVDLRKPLLSRGLYSVRVEDNRTPSQAQTLPVPTTEPQFLDKVETPNPPPIPKEVVVFPPQEPPTEEPIVESPASAPFQSGFIWYGPQYVDRRVSTSEVEEIKLTGLELINFGGHFSLNPGTWFGRLSFRYSQARYLVKDKRAYPFQEPADLREYEVGYSVLLPNSPFEFGLMIGERPVAKKTGLESFRLDPSNVYGPSVGYSIKKADWGWQSSLALLFSSSGFTVPVQSTLWSSPSALQGTTFGFRGELEIRSGENNWQNIRLMIPVGYSY